MIAEAPRHGYELIKAIEERMGGGYSPSPGVIYPTLSWLEDMGYAVPEAEGGRKSYRITPEGRGLPGGEPRGLRRDRGADGRGGGRRSAPEPVLRAMEGLKRALRSRFARGPVDAPAAEAIAEAIRAAAEEVERTMTMAAEATGGLTSTATVVTPKAAGYAAQLAKHFAHRIPARFEGDEGEIAFQAGTCRLRRGRSPDDDGGGGDRRGDRRPCRTWWRGISCASPSGRSSPSSGRERNRRRVAPARPNAAAAGAPRTGDDRGPGQLPR